MKSNKYSFLILLLTLTFACSNGYMFVDRPKNADPGVNPTPTPTVIPTPEPRSGIGGDGILSGEVPTVPQNLRILSVGSNHIELGWDDSLRELGYRLYYRRTSGSYSAVNRFDLSENTTSYLHSGLQQGYDLCYRIKAYNVSGDSELSNEVCAATLQCSNTTGPVISFSTASPEQQYPSVNNGSLFTKNSTVSLKYALNDSDNCNSLFEVTFKLYSQGGSDPIQTWSKTVTSRGSKTENYTVADYADTSLYIGFYDLEISATDGTFSDTSRINDYFRIIPLPADNSNPFFVSKSQDLEVCPDQNYQLTFTLSDDSIPPLSSSWLHSYIYMVGVGSPRTHTYNTTISRTESYPRQSQPLSENVIRQYYPDAYDYTTKGLTNPSSEEKRVTITVIRDTQVPSVNFTSLPANAQLPSDLLVALYASGSDNCPRLQYRFAFRDVFGAEYLIRSYNTSANVSFKPADVASGLPINTLGRFEVTVQDSSGNTAAAHSDQEYMFVPGHIPSVSVSTNPAGPFTTLQQINIAVSVTDNDPTDMILNRLYYIDLNDPQFHQNNIINSAVPLAGNESTTWATPLFAGDYIIIAEVIDNEQLSALGGLTINVNASDSNTSIVYLDYDLNGQMPFNRTVLFDLDANGVPEWTKWLNPGDGYLVIDRNNNGIIDDGEEFARLSEMISGAGNVLNENDAMFNIVKIWIDANSDASTNSGELRSLSGAGIIEITLNPCCSFLRW